MPHIVQNTTAFMLLRKEMFGPDRLFVLNTSDRFYKQANAQLSEDGGASVRIDSLVK